jgi:hypothetical protein
MAGTSIRAHSVVTFGVHTPRRSSHKPRPHVWSEDDFKKVKRALHSLGDDATTLQWQRIEQFGEKGVRKALGPTTSAA